MECEMIDRRKTLYCGPSHKFIPTLKNLSEKLKEIQDQCEDITGLTYASHAKMIRILAAQACIEVDKLIMKDIEATEELEVAP